MTDAQLKGLNIGGWFSQIDAIEEKDPDLFGGVDAHMAAFITAEDLDYIRTAGFDHARVPVDYQLFFDDNGSLAYPDRMDLLESSVRSILERGLLVILDLHRCPGHFFHEGWQKPQEFFTDPEKRIVAKRVWSYLAERFGFDTRICFEILNEPVAAENRVWDEIKNEMAMHIRSIAKDNILIVGSNMWNSAHTFDDLTPLKDDNVIYSFHYYNPLLFTHQKAPWIIFDEINRTREYPGEYYVQDPEARKKLAADDGVWNKDRMRESLSQVLSFRSKYGLPVACNEFGVFHQAPRLSQLRWISDFLDILDEVGIGYSYWTYKNLDFGLISDGEKLHSSLPQFQNDRRLDAELAGLLAGQRKLS